MMILLPSDHDAASAYADPSSDNCTETARSGVWNAAECEDAFATEFSEVLVLVGRALSPAELSWLSGCLGYALRAALCGEELSVPDVTYWQDEYGRITTIFQFSHDST